MNCDERVVRLSVCPPADQHHVHRRHRVPERKAELAEQQQRRKEEQGEEHADLRG